MKKEIEYRVRRVGDRNAYYSNEGYSGYYRRMTMYGRSQVKTIYGLIQARHHVKELLVKYPTSKFFIERRVTIIQKIK